MYLIQDELPNFQLASFSDVRWYHKRDVIRKELFSLPEDRRGNTQGLRGPYLVGAVSLASKILKVRNGLRGLLVKCGLNVKI